MKRIAEMYAAVEAQRDTLIEALEEIESAATAWPMESVVNRLAGIAEVASTALAAARPVAPEGETT